jgi:hypothetical protein
MDLYNLAGVHAAGADLLLGDLDGALDSLGGSTYFSRITKR